MKRDNQLAARVLAQWAFKHFKLSELAVLTASYNLAERTLWNWKKALQTDEQLAVLYEERLNELLNQDWVKTLDLAIGVSINKVSELMAKSESLPEVTEAFKALAEMKLTHEVLIGKPSPETVQREASLTAQRTVS
jgi:hypothetical protein